MKVNPENTVLKLEGAGVKLVGESEYVRKDGVRESSKKVDKASEGFTAEFTQKFEKIAESIPVFYEMRNLFDLSVAAAFIQTSGLYSQANWSAKTFGNEQQLPVQNVSAPSKWSQQCILCGKVRHLWLRSAEVFTFQPRPFFPTRHFPAMRRSIKIEAPLRFPTALTLAYGGGTDLSIRTQ